MIYTVFADIDEYNAWAAPLDAWAVEVGAPGTTRATAPMPHPTDERIASLVAGNWPASTMTGRVLRTAAGLNSAGWATSGAVDIRAIGDVVESGTWTWQLYAIFPDAATLDTWRQGWQIPDGFLTPVSAANAPADSRLAVQASPLLPVGSVDGLTVYMPDDISGDFPGVL